MALPIGFSLKPIWGKKLVGREIELNEIKINIINNKTGYALYGMRRVGKTSIFLELKNQFEKDPKIAVTYISLWGLLPSSLENFIKEFLIQVLDVFKSHIRLELRIREIMKLESPSIKKTLESVALPTDLKEKIAYLLDVWKQREVPILDIAKDVFKLPELLAIETKKMCVILIDEFPTILGYEHGKSLVEYLRTIYEKQTQVVYCIAGSERKTMEAVALDTTAPFYKQFITKEIMALDKSNMEIFLKQNLLNIEITAGAIDRIYEYTKGLPYYINLIGIAIQNRKDTLNDGILNEKKVEEIILLFLDQEGGLYYNEEYEKLTNLDRFILGTMALYGAKTLTDISHVTKNSNTLVSTYLFRLKRKKIITQDIQGEYKIKDPMFEQWIKYEFKGLE